MPDRKQIPGKFVWFELVTTDAAKAQAFYRAVLGWKTVPFPMGDFSYDMIHAGDTPDTMIGGYVAANGAQASHWISYLSVEDVDAAAARATANGGKLVAAPHELPDVGRSARIADPQGAELCLFKSATGDAPDRPKAPPGTFFWNELHTSDTAGALAFYEKLVGFSHETMDAGGGAYHVLSKSGEGRGGVTGHLQKGVKPHWLPYVCVDDPDATVASAKKHGASLPMGVEDIPGVGRFGILQDPTGAVLAVMKPLPRQKA